MTGKKVLIVEDDSDIRQIISHYLKEEGFEVIELARGEGILEIVEKEKPDLISLDIMLPGIDGFEVIKILKDSALAKDIPIIIVSVLGKDNKYQQAVADFISKPFEKKDLIDCVKNILSTKGQKTPAQKKILVVDDEPDIVDIISTYLKDTGFRYDKAFDGQEAILKTRQENPDLIILDIKMPKLNGFEVIKILKTDQKTWSIPIVVLTGTHISEEDKVEGLKLGVSAYMSKPFDPRDLIERIKQILC